MNSTSNWSDKEQQETNERACKVLGHRERPTINTISLAMAITCDRCGIVIAHVVG